MTDWRSPHPNLHDQELVDIFEDLEQTFSRGFQRGVIELTWPGGSIETNKVKVKFPYGVSKDAQVSLTIYASGVIAVPYINAQNEVEMEIGVATTNGATPAAGTKQKVSWIVLSS